MTVRLFQEDERGSGGGPRDFCGRYILVNRLPVPEPNLFKWAKWMGDAHMAGLRRVATGAYQRHGKRIWISTVFLGLDYNFSRIGDPLVFETAVFTGHSHYDIMMERYASWREAEEGHYRMFEQAKAEILGMRALAHN